MEIFRLFGSVLVDNASADASIAATDGNAQGLHSRFLDGISTAGKWGLAIGGAAVVGGAALLGLASSASDTASDIADMSAKMGLSKEGFQEWKYVLSQSGVDVGVLQGSMKKFTGIMDDANSGNKQATSKFKELGISMSDLKKMTPEQAFNATVKALQGMPDGAHKSALAADLLGKSSTELGSILSGTNEDLENAKKHAHDMGIVMSDEAVDAGDTFGDTMDDVKLTLGALVTKIGVEVMPIIQKMLDWFMEHSPQIKEVVRVAFDIVKKAIDGVGIAFNAVKDFFVRNWGILEPIMTAIGAFAAPFIVYALAIGAISLATTIWASVTAIATGVMTAFGVVMAFVTSPIGLILIAIGLLIAAGVLIYKNWDVIKEKAIEIFTAIHTWIDQKITAIIKFFTDAVKDFLKAGKDIFTGIWDGIKAVYLLIESWIGTTITAIVKFFTDAVKDFLKAGKDIFTGIWDGIKAVYLLIESWIGTTITAIVKFFTDAVKDFLKAGKDIFTGIWDGIKAVYLLIESWIGQTITAIVKFFTDAVKDFLKAGKDIFTGIWDGIKEVYLEIETWISQTITAMVKFFTDSVTSFKQVGKDIFTGVWDGIKDVWANISTWVSDKITWLTDKLSFWKTSQNTMSGGTTTTKTSIKARAVGGPVNANEPYLVGENGPELYIPNNSGTIIPNNKLSNNAGTKNNIQIILTGNTIMNDRDADALGDLLIRRLKALGV